MLSRGATFLGSWSFHNLLAVVWAIGAMWMNVRSLRTLTDQSVKAYFV